MNPVVRGSIEMPSSVNKSRSMRPVYVAIEGLTPSTNYTLSFYVINEAYIEKEQVKHMSLLLDYSFRTSVFNRSRTTSQFQLFSKKLNEEEVYNYETDDEDYNEEDEYDDSDDYLDPSIYESKKITSCDLSSESNNFIKINYASSALKRLITFVSNSSFSNKTIWNELSSNINNFKDFFYLNQMDKDSLDHFVYYDCLKQAKSLSKEPSNVMLSKPLCLVNIAPTWTQSDFSNDHEIFSVHTGFQLPKESQKSFLIYIASTCHQKRRSVPVTKVNLNTLNLLPVLATTNFNEVLNDENSKSSNREIFFHKTTETRENTTSANIVRSNFLKPPNITNCVINNENELQFNIEHFPTDKKIPKQLESFRPEPALFYIIEFEIPGYYKKQLQIGKQRNLPGQFNHSSASKNKFYIRKEHDFQVRNASQISLDILFLFFD